MAQSLTTLSAEQVATLPLDRLGMFVLQHLKESREWNEQNFVNDFQQAGLRADAVKCLAEALNWLISRNLVSRNKPGSNNSDAIFITRLGERALKEGIALVQASERLDAPLHDRLIKVRSQFLIGEYEIAAFAAMREVEIRVRELAAAEPSLIGVKLMRKAFGDGGALADGELDAGERVGIMELFAGAIGTFKNPPSHRQVDYANPTEASEVVVFADLLMRLLDRREKR